MRKRILALLLVCVMLISAVGCSSNGDGGTPTGTDDAPVVNDDALKAMSEDAAVLNATTGDGSIPGYSVTTDNITLTYWHYEDETTVALLAEAFMLKYPNIKVECRLISDMSTDCSAAAAAGTFPDVFSGTDSDTALANMYWRDISEWYDADPETKNIMSTINEYGIGCFDTKCRYALPTWYMPSAVFIDRNVIEKLNLQMPRTDWTWNEMIDLIKAATLDDRSGMKYYGLGYYNRLDSLYGIAACSAAERRIKGEFGFDGDTFDLSYWAIGEQQFSDLKLGGYVAPQQNTQAMEDWSGDYANWFGATAHVAVFSEGFWTYQNLWGQEGYQEQYGLDIVPYVTPNVVDEKQHNVIANMYMGGVSTSCKHPYEAYLLLKFMTFGVDGWLTRLEIYKNPKYTNASGTPLKNSNMPCPITLDEKVWEGYKSLFPQDADHKQYWDDYFSSITRPVSYGWYNIAGYWNFCDQYFNSIGIHELVDAGQAKAADYALQATEQANFYHADAMISYFGPSGYNVLSAEELAHYQATVDSFGR